MLMQISFAAFKGHPEMIWKPSEPVWFQLYADARKAQIEALSREMVERESDYQAGGLPVPPAHVIAQIQRNFARVDG